MTFHHLTADSYGVIGTSQIAHLRNGEKSLCGKTVTGPVPTGENAWRDSLGYRTGQHCIDCDAEYRRRNGATPITYDF